jgi:hypothetical protein
VPSNGACTDDGYSCTRELCAPSGTSSPSGCQRLAVDADCPDDSFCDGSEVCEPTRTSVAYGVTGCADALAVDVPCDPSDDLDSRACTDTECVEDTAPGTGHCVSTANDDHCDNDVFCDGLETCNPAAPTADVGGCVLAPPSCPGTTLPACAVPICNEGPETCGAAVNAVYNCGDGDPCTMDTCNPAANVALNPTGCQHAMIGGCVGCMSAAECVDAHSCTVDTCVNNTCGHDESACECLADADCDDGFSCTVDSCAPDGTCNHAPSDAFCVASNLPGGVCNGVDICTPSAVGAGADGCVHSTTALDCDDGLTCTDDSCDPVMGCVNEADDMFCEQQDPVMCDGVAFCNESADPGVNALGCENPTGYDPCPDDGIACTVETCVEPTATLPLRCATDPDDDYCIAQPGGCGETCQVGVGCTSACVPTSCQGKTYACGDCADNDGDCRVDTLSDPACLGPCSDNEEGYSGEIPGQNNAPCKMDCYFDQDTGAGNDGCYWSHSCDPLSLAPGYPPSGDNKCAYSPSSKIPGEQLTCAQAQATQGTQCWDATPPVAAGENYCGALVPNGCDCFGCCEIPGLTYAVYLGSTDSAGAGTCTPETLQDPALCKPCTQVAGCRNTCQTCEICVGKPELPSSCACQQCAPGAQLCGDPCGTPCAAGYFCSTGCCVLAPL